MSCADCRLQTASSTHTHKLLPHGASLRVLGVISHRMLLIMCLCVCVCVCLQVSSLRHLASNENLSLFPDFNNRLAILKILGYVDADQQTVTLKGRVACEMNTCDELIATEMLFDGVLEPLNPPEAAAILSALVFQEKGHEGDVLTSRMEVAREQLQTLFQGTQLSTRVLLFILCTSSRSFPQYIYTSFCTYACLLVSL
jgi:DSHCT (NUC185) domain